MIADHEFQPDVRVDLDGQPFLTLVQARQDGAAQASIHRARIAQRNEREDAIYAFLEAAPQDFAQHCLADAIAAERVAEAMPSSLPLQDRRDAGAVAVRLHDPRWQMISRYYAADAVLVELRKYAHVHGWYTTDSDLRVLADRLASVAHVARFQAWTGQTLVSVRQWAKACLGFLMITEER